MDERRTNRRSFLRSAITTGGALIIPPLGHAAALSDTALNQNINELGPIDGYSPHVGTLVSMLNWMRMTILQPVLNLTKGQLDYVHDNKANSIGAMLLHLAATERFYQVHTLEDKKWGDWSERDKERFDVAMKLGEEARKTIKGNDLDFYLSTLKEVRDHTLRELKNRDDKWLLKVDKGWYWGPTNNYCKWFHVCEHESNHNGQIKWIKGRLAGVKSASD